MVIRFSVLELGCGFAWARACAQMKKCFWISCLLQREGTIWFGRLSVLRAVLRDGLALRARWGDASAAMSDVDTALAADLEAIAACLADVRGTIAAVRDSAAAVPARWLFR